jgi:hypothetical protein
MIEIREQLRCEPDIRDLAFDGSRIAASGWQPHVILRRDGDATASKTAGIQFLNSTDGPRINMQMPNLVYMPDLDRLLLTAEYGPPPVYTISRFSDDRGLTWSAPESLRGRDGELLDARMSVGTTYLGNGQLMLDNELTSTRQFSIDGGRSWGETVEYEKPAAGEEIYHWDAPLIDRDVRGEITRLLEGRYRHTGRAWDSGTGAYSHAGLRYSSDEGRTWSAFQPQPGWLGVNEVALIRAANGDIVAACRTDNPQRFIGQLDLHSGMGISISRDNGQTWSELDLLFDSGRHHPSMVLLPGGELLMTYAVRAGYEDSADGYPQYGIEAIISRDHGRTWALDRRYILATWRGSIQGENAWWGLPQSTSTVQLPDGALLAAFGTGVRNQPGQSACVMDIALVRWAID